LLVCGQGKDLELQVLRDRVNELDEWLSQVNSRVQEEAYGKVSARIQVLKTKIG